MPTFGQRGFGPVAFIPSLDSPLAVVCDTLILSFGTVKYLSILYFVDTSLRVNLSLVYFVTVYYFFASEVNLLSRV